MKFKSELNNIIIAAASDFPFNTASANLIRRFSELLIKMGFTAEVLLLRGSVDKLNQYSKSRVGENNNVKYTYCSFKNKPKFFISKFLEIFIGSFVATLKIIIRKLINQVGIVVLYTGYPYYNLPIFLICKLLRIKIIKLSVDWYDKEQVVIKPYYIFKWWFFKLEISIFDRFLDAIIVLNLKLKEHYIKLKIPEDKILVLPAIIEEFEIKNNINKLTSKKIICYSGGAPLQNGVDVLIEAFKVISKVNEHIELLIIGDTSGINSELPGLKDKVRDYNIQDKVTFTGRIATSDVYKRISESSILVLPRKRSKFADSGFPTKLSEYFLTKRPVILTKVGDFPYYFSDKKEVVFCESDDPVSLAEALMFLINNNEEARIIGENGYKWVINNLHHENIGRKLISFLHSI